MATIITILAGMVTVTLGYSWTVAQSGLLQANRNLCELWNAVSPLPPYQSCEFHYVLVGAWLVALLAAAIIAARKSTQWVQQTARPHGGVRSFGRHCYVTVASRTKSGWARVEPSHVIILGLGIAAIGVIWQLQRNTWSDPKKIVELRTQLEATQKELTNARTTESPSTPSKKKYFSYDIEERLKAIDSIDNTLSKIAGLNSQGENLLNHISEIVKAGNAPDELLKYENEAKQLFFGELNGVLEKYRTRFPDIVDPVMNSPNKHLAYSNYSTSVNLRQELDKWAGKPEIWPYIENHRFMLEWQQSVRVLSTWLQTARNDLALKRLEYRNAEVYGAVPK